MGEKGCMNQYPCINFFWFYLGHGVFTEKLFKKYSTLLEDKGELIEESEERTMGEKVLREQSRVFSVLQCSLRLFLLFRCSSKIQREKPLVRSHFSLHSQFQLFN